MLEFQGKHAAFIADETPEIEVEGCQSTGKTIAALWKELQKLKIFPGIWTFITRWVEDDVHTLLRPEFERLARIDKFDLNWNSREKAYECPNGSRCFAFGLRTTEIDPIRRYGKIRGLPISRACVDQAEQLPPDFAVELRRRLRPDIEARTKGIVFPFQLTFVANVVQNSHWLARQFPENNSVENRRYYSLGLSDNAHNLPPELIKQAMIDCPPTDPRYRELILGRRPPLIDWSKLEKKPLPPDSAGALFEQAQREAERYHRTGSW